MGSQTPAVLQPPRGSFSHCRLILNHEEFGEEVASQIRPSPFTSTLWRSNCPLTPLLSPAKDCFKRIKGGLQTLIWESLQPCEYQKLNFKKYGRDQGECVRLRTREEGMSKTGPASALGGDGGEALGEMWGGASLNCAGWGGERKIVWERIDPPLH